MVEEAVCHRTAPWVVGDADYTMLKQVVDTVDGYEFPAYPLLQWERAILDVFRVFRELRDSESGCGIVSVDLDSRAMTFKDEPAPVDKLSKPKLRAKMIGALPPPVMAKLRN